MPLKPKRGLPPGRTTGCNSNLKVLSKNPTPKNTGKSSFAGKQSGKRAARTKAGYELYSSDSKDPKQENARGYPNSAEPFRTLVEEWMAKQTTSPHSEYSESAELIVENHQPNNESTLFNKRLVSSTPDPEKVINDGLVDVQVIPERDTNQELEEKIMQASFIQSGAGIILSEAERQRIRQQIDAALIEEAQAKNKQLQEQWKDLQYRQQQQQAKVSLGHGQPPLKKRVFPASAAPQSSLPDDQEGVLYKQVSHGKNIAARDGVPFSSKSASCASSVSKWHDVITERPTVQGSDIGVFHHFLNRESADLPLQFQQTSDAKNNGQVFVPYVADSVTNMSMGFTPSRGIEASLLAGLDSRSTGGLPRATTGAVSRPVKGSTSEEVSGPRAQQQVHAATPAGSPVLCRAKSAYPSHSITTDQPACPPDDYTYAQYMKTPASSPESNKSEPILPAKGDRRQQLQNASGQGLPVSIHRHQRDVKKKSDQYTSDGYYINDSVGFGKVTTSREQQLFPATPAHSPPQTCGRKPLIAATSSAAATQRNENNNSDPCCKQANINQNMHYNNAAYLPAVINQAHLNREAMAEMEFPGFPFSSASQGMLSEVLNPAPANSPTPLLYADREVLSGPRRLRSLLTELKETCAVDGDMEVCHLVQQITDLVELLPQLKQTFNMETEINLAMQPLRSECSQLRRRLRILNQQLRERERQEKEGLEPKVQVEILTLQTENMELQKKLTEAEASCQKLNAFIGKQQQELQQTKCHISQMEHENLLIHQEDVQKVTRLNQELEKMSLRNQSLQSKLSAADCQNSVLDLNLKQRNMEIVQLQHSLGKMKQAVSEVVQHLDRSKGDSSNSAISVHSLPSFRLLRNMLSTVPFYSRSYEQTGVAVASSDPLETSGNHRVLKISGPRIINSHPITEKQNLTNMLRTKNLSVKEHSNAKFISNKDGSVGTRSSTAVDPSYSKNSLSTGSLPPSQLTVEAVTAHNQHLETMEDSLSCHSWDGGEHQSSTGSTKNLSYYSDPESKGFQLKETSNNQHKHRLRIQQWSATLEEERLPADGGPEQGLHTAVKYKKSSEGKADTETLQTLSEFPFTESESGDSDKRYRANVGSSRHSVTDYFKKHPDTKQQTVTSELSQRSLLTVSQDKAGEMATLSPKESSDVPTASSPNTSLVTGPANISQKDYFHGTELDLSLSTIPEDGLSIVTGLTGVSISTALSLDDRKFKEGVNALDEKIVKCKESLQIWKKTFS